MIEVKGLSKDYRVAVHHRGFRGALRNLVERRSEIVQAVKGIDFHIAQGEFVGFIGPNGAGKSTTIKILTGVLEPTSGVATVGGLVPRRDRIEHTRNIGVVFGQRTQLWWDLPVIESYELLRAIYNVPRPAFDAQLMRLAELLALGELLDRPVRKLSLGQRMRCELAAALLHAPRLLFLDEPTIGLDVVAKETIRRFLRAENEERGTTILLTTHDLSDIERLCPRMILIDHGQLVYDGELESIRRRFGAERRLEVEFEGDAPTELPNGVVEEERAEERLVVRFRRDEVPSASVIAWLAERRPIADLTLQEPPIERIVGEIYPARVARRRGCRVSWSQVVREWGSTPAERQATYPCDDELPDQNDAYFRALSVGASPAVVYRWLCQLRVAPYSYDWIDNLGRRSPQTLTPGLEQLEVGQRVMQIFDLASFEPNQHLTLRLRRPGLFPPLAVSYVVVPEGESDGCRLIVKLAVRFSGGWVGRALGAGLALGDWVMMRRQLLNLRDLAERSARPPGR